MVKLLSPIKRLLSAIPSADLLPDPLRDFGHFSAAAEDQQLSPSTQ
jgi:hypothetical protein